VLLPSDYTFQPSDGGMVTFPSGVTLITLGDETRTVTDTASGITGSVTVTVTSPAAPLQDASANLGTIIALSNVGVLLSPCS
jgi:hypothetical protein